MGDDTPARVWKVGIMESGPADNQTAQTRPSPAVRCRRIEAHDIALLSLFLAEGFPARSAATWQASLEALLRWKEQRSLPGVGFVLTDGETIVGCLLTLYAPDGSRCSFSSWYVAAGYRRFGTILVSAALRDRSLTYLNISSEKDTRPIIEAQGFKRYSSGVLVAAPLLSLASLNTAGVLWSDPRAADEVSIPERQLMEDHAAFGCICFWCSDQGRIYPIVLARRPLRGLNRVAQLIFCPADMDWRRLGGAVGRAMARHGLFLLLLDAEGPIPGLPGRFFDDRMPKYCRGPAVPRLGDLAYTEAALIGT